MMPTSRWGQHFAPLLRRPVITTLLAAVGPIPCHLVGGVLRDFLLDTPSRDLDVIVERNGRGVAERIATELGARLVLLGGDRFAAFRIVAKDLVLDLWDREQKSLTADLARRDFTVNSFALDLQDPKVVDPYSGLDDLAARRLRATTELSFTGDPLRVLRLARFGGQLAGSTVVRQTLELAPASRATAGKCRAGEDPRRAATPFQSPGLRRVVQAPWATRGLPHPVDRPVTSLSRVDGR